MIRTVGWFPRDVPPSLEHSLDEAAIKRIVESTEANRRIKWQFDANDLRIDLIWCYSQYRSRDRLRSSKLAKSSRQHLMEIAKAADNFSKRLEGELSDQWCRNQIAGALRKQIPDLFSENGTSIGKIVHAVRVVGKIARSAADPKSSDYAIVLLKGKNSAFEETVADDFVQTFERHTGRNATRSRPSSGGEADSPFIRFVVSTFKEFGQSYKPETVARALAKSSRFRRAKK
jgi:hypothetical protein